MSETKVEAEPDSVFTPEHHLPSSNSLKQGIFLAGGITGCPDWQKEAIIQLKPHLQENTVIFNPRRQFFDPDQKDQTLETQILWEFQALQLAHSILFWFPKESICPIALFELGKYLVIKGNKPLFVGTEPGYVRSADLQYQLALERPDIHIVHSLKDLVSQVVFYWQHQSGNTSGVSKDASGVSSNCSSRSD